MIYAVFGMPGSGKSYYVVNEFIVKRLETNTIISNIALSPDVEIPQNYHYLEKTEMDRLHFQFKEIMEDASTSHDEKKIKLAKVLSSYGDGDITVIVDECHLYGYRGRSTSISYIDDLLSIHRHIFPDRKVDFVLITQVPSRLNTEIAAQVEIAVSAVPASQRVITSMLEYSVYGSVDALKKKDKDMRMKRQIIKGDPKVFALYQSGFVLKGSNDFRKKLIVMLLGISILVYYVFHGFFTMSTSSDFYTKKVKNKSQDKIVSSGDINITKEHNITLVQKSYKIVCRSVPFSFRASSVKNWLYSIYHNHTQVLCYKVFI